MLRQKFNILGGTVIVQSGSDKLCTLNSEIYDIFNGNTSVHHPPQKMYRAVIIHIDPQKEHGGLFDTRQIIHNITKEFHPFLIGFFALPPAGEWIDWAYAIGYDAVIFYVRDENEFFEKIHLVRRAEKIFPRGTCGLISEKPLNISQVLPDYRQVKFGSVYFYSHEKHPVLQILLKQNTSLLSPADIISMRLKNLWFKLRRNLRVRVEEE